MYWAHAATPKASLAIALDQRQEGVLLLALVSTLLPRTPVRLARRALLNKFWAPDFLLATADFP